jgi:hypothetical protein
MKGSFRPERAVEPIQIIELTKTVQFPQQALLADALSRQFPATCWQWGSISRRPYRHATAIGTHYARCNRFSLSDFFLIMSQCTQRSLSL